ncbi:glycosyltransferase family 2 protein [Sinomicrobium sp.]
MELEFSFVVPVYNRPEELTELLDSISCLKYERSFEVVVVEDGSTIRSDEVVKRYSDKMNISYFYKDNTGPGDSRNYGMRKAKGNYFLILDSDCILPPNYLGEVERELEGDFVHCFGGPDTAHPSFSSLQKAINYAMTSTLTTGGIRGKKKAVGKFQPRSFNMGISKEAFLHTGGFGKIHPGEDPDLTIRLWEAGYNTRFFEAAYVYHKRRISWKKFYTQVYKFGMTRPILNRWHPQTEKPVYWLPSLFVIGLLFSLSVCFLGHPFYLKLYLIFFGVILFDAWYSSGRIKIALMSVFAVLVQFFGYGYGFIKSTFYIKILKRVPEKVFPKLFFQ